MEDAKVIITLSDAANKILESTSSEVEFYKAKLSEAEAKLNQIMVVALGSSNNTFPEGSKYLYDAVTKSLTIIPTAYIEEEVKVEVEPETPAV